MESEIKKLLIKNGQALFGSELIENVIQFQPTRKDVEGDFTLVVFPFVKLLKCSPEEAGEKIGSFLISHISEIDSYEVIKGFLNIKLTDSYWLNELKTAASKKDFGFFELESKPMVMVEYSSPNTNKPLHLG
ncbi:MAG: arginine--tRNA ligase, partial [Bacteroidota bacterium]